MPPAESQTPPRVLIAGIDGYLGWTLAMYLAKRGYEVAAEAYFRHQGVAEPDRMSAMYLPGFERA